MAGDLVLDFYRNDAVENQANAGPCLASGFVLKAGESTRFKSCITYSD